MLDLPAPKSPRRITWNSFSSFGVGFDIVDLVVVVGVVTVVVVVVAVGAETFVAVFDRFNDF